MRMRALTALGLAALIAVMSLAATAQQADARRYRGVGWGIAAGVATGIIISEAYRGRHYRPYYGPRARYIGYYHPGYVYRNYGYSHYDDYDYYESRPYRVFRPYSYYSPYRAYRVRSPYRRAYYRRHR